MSRWSLLIYGIAALLAVQTLLALMVQHRRRTFADLVNAEARRRAAEAADLEAQQELLPGLEKKKPAETTAKAA
ncbi:MAG: hypothetical protein Q8K78_09510 [Planctomycetaceae bacterium]|nr:hypothetical protein [Planctomycetaceae bacterium]